MWVFKSSKCHLCCVLSETVTEAEASELMVSLEGEFLFVKANWERKSESRAGSRLPAPFSLELRKAVLGAWRPSLDTACTLSPAGPQSCCRRVAGERQECQAPLCHGEPTEQNLQGAREGVNALEFPRAACFCFTCSDEMYFLGCCILKT